MTCKRDHDIVFVMSNQDNLRYQLPEYQRKDFDLGVEVAKKLADQVNGGNTVAVALGIVAELQHTHRYLQNEVIFTLLRTLVSLADENVDDRNRWGIQQCKWLCERLGLDCFKVETRPKEIKI